jgi:hypothetical protein
MTMSMQGRLPLLLTMIVASLALGCESAPRAVTLEKALAEYNAGRFDAAHEQAVDVMRGTSGAEREQAAYLAGLSAYRRGDLDEAELRLSAAVNASDAHTAASAKAMLGQVRLARGRPAEAAALFEDSARGLEGEDSRQASRLAAAAHERAGNQEAADRLHQSTGRSAVFASHSTAPHAYAGSFAIQVGAYQDRKRAEQAAADASAIGHREGLGAAWIVPKADARGRMLYHVQFGSFATHTAAANARRRIGRQEFIVSTLLRP